MLEIHAFGGLIIQQDEKPVGNLASRKAEALLVYLASTRQPHSREALADLLWDDRSQKQALGNLRVLLSSLRRKLGSYLLIERQHVAFDHESDFRLDTAQFDAILTAIRDMPEQDNPMSESTVAQLRNAVALYRGDFLSGFHVRESRGFEEWALLERERLQRLVINALYDLTTFSFSSEDYKAGIEAATRLGSYAQAQTYFEQALQPNRELGHRRNEGMLLSNLSLLFHLRGNHERARIRPASIADCPGNQ